MSTPLDPDTFTNLLIADPITMTGEHDFWDAERNGIITSDPVGGYHVKRDVYVSNRSQILRVGDFILPVFSREGDLLNIRVGKP